MAIGLARLVIAAVKVERRSKSEVAREYGVSRRWVQKLVACYDAEGEAAYTPGEILRELTLNPTRDYQPRQ